MKEKEEEKKKFFFINNKLMKSWVYYLWASKQEHLNKDIKNLYNIKNFFFFFLFFHYNSNIPH